MYDVTVNNIGFVLKTKYDTDKSDLEKKLVMQTKKFLIPADLKKKKGYNATITKIECKIASITGLASNSALTAVGNKIPDIINLVKKTGYNTKISENRKETY